VTVDIRRLLFLVLPPILLAGCTSSTTGPNATGATYQPYQVSPEICRSIDFAVVAEVFGESAMPDSLAEDLGRDNRSFILMEDGTVRCGQLMGGLPGRPGGFAAVEVTLYDSEEQALAEHSPSPVSDWTSLSTSPTGDTLPDGPATVADEIRVAQDGGSDSSDSKQTTALVRHEGLVIVADLNAIGGNQSLGPAAARLPAVAVALAEEAFVAVRSQQPR